MRLKTRQEWILLNHYNNSIFIYKAKILFKLEF